MNIRSLSIKKPYKLDDSSTQWNRIIVWIRFSIVLSLVLVSIREKRKEDAKMISTSPPRLYFPSTRYEFQFVPPSAQLSSDENPFVSFVRPPFSPAIVRAPRYYAKHNNYFRCVLSPSLVNPLVIDILEFSPTGCFCALYLQKGMGSLTTTLSNVDSSALEPRMYPLRGRRRPPRNIDDAIGNSTSSGVYF